MRVKDLTNVNPKEIMLENILAVMGELTFSKELAAKIVGGEKRLLELIADGEVECEKPTYKKNGKWFCNAAQVLRHCKLMRPRR